MRARKRLRPRGMDGDRRSVSHFVPGVNSRQRTGLTLVNMSAVEAASSSGGRGTQVRFGGITLKPNPCRTWTVLLAEPSRRTRQLAKR